MNVFAPMVRALCERERRPNLVRLLAGLALIAPAMLLEHRIGQQPGKSGLRLPTPAEIPALVVDVSKDALELARLENPVFEAWLGSRMARTSPLNARFAQEYRISEPLAAEIHQAAVANRISPHVAFGLVRAESSFRPRVVSPVGAIGLTQVMPATARGVEPGTSRADLMEPGTNLRIGFKYLRQLIDDYGGNERLALTAFNRGPGTVNKLLKRGRNPDNGYADKVITGKSARHVALMNSKFGRKRSRS